MRFNTHDRTPRPKTGKLIKTLLAICMILVFSIFALGAFASVYYEHNIIAGIIIILIPFAMTAIGSILITDMLRAYVEIIDDSIVIVDYYFGIKKEKHYTFQDIESVKAELGYSFHTRGYRMRGIVQYLVFRGHKNKYLFKVAYFPETKEFFEKYFNIINS